MALPDGIKSVEQLAVEGKRVFVRVDYNVPLAKGAKGANAGARKVGDDARIAATLPTLRLLIERGCPKINLLVRSSNAEVVAFYRKLGYTQDDVISLGRRLIHDA